MKCLYEVLSQLSTLCSQVRDIQSAISTLTADKKALMSQIATLAESTNSRSISGSSWKLSKVTRTSRTINSAKLLEKGVSLHVIEFATDKSTSTYWQVKGAGKKTLDQSLPG